MMFPGGHPFGPSSQTHIQFNGKNLFDAAAEGDLPTTIFLWEQGHRMYDLINRPDSTGVVALHWAAYHGRLPIVRFLVMKGANVNRKCGSEDATALMWAACSGHLDVIDYLLSHGADVNICDAKGYTAPMQAVQHGQLLALHLLVSRSPSFDVHAVDTCGHTMVHWAAYKGYVQPLRYLVDQLKIAVNAVDEEQRTALHWAARQGKLDCARFVVSKGVNLLAKDRDNHTAYEWAVEFGHSKTAAFLDRCHRFGTPSSSSSPQQTSNLPGSTPAGATTNPRSASPASAAAAAMLDESEVTVGTIAFLREDMQQLIRFILTITAIGLHFFILSWIVPWAVSFWLPFLIMFVPGCSDVLVMLKLRAPPAGFTGPTCGPRPYGRDLAWTACSIAFVGLVYQSFFLTDLFWYSLKHSPLRTLALFISAVVAAFYAVRTSKTDPGYFDTALLVDPKSEMFQAVDRGDFDSVKDENKSQDPLSAPSKRGHPCAEVQRCVIRFDHFNRALDTPIGIGNHRPYFLFVLFQFVALALTLVLTVNFVQKDADSTSDTPAGLGLWDMSTCHKFGWFFFSGVPGAVRWLWHLATLTPTTPTHHLEFWLIIVNSVFCFGLLFELVNQINLISHNITFAEAFLHPKLEAQLAQLQQQQSPGGPGSDPAKSGSSRRSQKRARYESVYSRGFINNWSALWSGNPK